MAGNPRTKKGKLDEENVGLTVGNKVALLGEHFRLTQGEWGHELGVHRGTISSYKNRANANPSPDEVRKMAARYGIPVSWFYNEIRDEPEVSRDIVEAISAAMVGKIKAIPEPHQTPLQTQFASGATVSLPVMRGVIAGPNDECHFPDDQTEPPTEVPGFFTFSAPREKFEVCIPAGMSMAPRISQGDFIICRKESSPPEHSIVVVRRPDNVNFIKVLRYDSKHQPYLESINREFKSITEVDGWVYRAVVVGIWKPYLTDDLNIEFQGGRPLRG